ncbi:DUF805 domain-containing protein [Deinococcus fonticola]|uniref:DUF805 domain-containing protein n=1 Tax=Deinococcus fonticola TaxID=2528713 RepID=UPI00107516FB|nr:DUF805 domain-containing protein [Deinococcus fonticola]
MNEYLNVIRRNYANFSGRARRREYWMFTLVNLIISTLLYIPMMALGLNPAASVGGDMAAQVNPLAYIFGGLYLLYSLAVLVPSLAVMIRRLHDTGKSGWWILIGIIPLASLVLLVFTIMDSEPGSNKWGPNPKGQGAALPTGSNW